MCGTVSAKGCVVPIVRIEFIGPREDVYVSALMRGVRQGIVTWLNAPDPRVAIRAIEVAEGHVDLPDCRTAGFTVVDVMLYEGRTAEAKAACSASIREALSLDPGIPASEVAIAYHDMTPDDLDVIPGEAGRES